MSDIEALLDELRGLPSVRPSGAAELQTLLAAARSAAGRWADVLEDIREASQGLAGPRTEAALEVAFRRAEESYVELEIALSACANPGAC
ncbi:hypothetical protein [Streptomyces sp. NPDC018833]|uniref:hypothetical protein n=1 Tax=Streptomyces sp. NPDC018833 TaxID=3365053 RepID=UPI0037BB6316